VKDLKTYNGSFISILDRSSRILF